MAKSWVMTEDHAAFAAKFPPREGYKCGSHAETYSGGCFNCGWKPDAKPRKVTISDLDEAQARVMGAIESAFAFAGTEVMLDSCDIRNRRERENAARSWEVMAEHIGREARRGQVEHYAAMNHARDAAYRLSEALFMGHEAAERLKSCHWHCACVSDITLKAQAAR